MAFFNNFIFRSLSTHFEINDADKDGNQEGTLQRYLKAIGEELDSYTYQFIQDLLNILDYTNTDHPDFVKFANHRLYSLGLKFHDYTKITFETANFNKTDEWMQARFIQYLSNLSRIRGTRKFVECVLNILGFDIADDTTAYYDGAMTYDSGEVNSQYDFGISNPTSMVRQYDQHSYGSIDIVLVLNYYQNPVVAVPAAVLTQLADFFNSDSYKPITVNSYTFTSEI